MSPVLVEGIDYYMEDGRLVFTAAYHRARGYCCNSKCRHCPYRKESGGAVTPPITIAGAPKRDRER